MGIHAKRDNGSPGKKLGLGQRRAPLGGSRLRDSKGHASRYSPVVRGLFPPGRALPRTHGNKEAVVIRAGSGLSVESDPTRAAIEAANKAMDEGCLDLPDAAFLFASGGHGERLSEIATTVAELTGVPVVTGGTGNGVLTSAGAVERGDAVALLLVESSDIRFRPFAFESIFGDDQAAARAVGRELEIPLHEPIPPNQLLILFPDPGVFHSPTFFQALEEEWGPLPAVGGGVASTRGSGLSLNGDAAVVRGVTGVGLEGSFGATIRRFSSARLISKAVPITQCRANRITKLAGIPALPFFQRLAGRGLGLDPLSASAVVFVVLGAEAGSIQRGDYVVRALVGISPSTKELLISQDVELGDELAFCLLESGEARRQLTRHLGDLAGVDAKFALYFNCSSRNSAFYGSSEVDVSYLRNALGSTPVAGFYTAAEFAPLAHGNELHLYTGVLLLVT